MTGKPKPLARLTSYEVDYYKFETGRIRAVSSRSCDKVLTEATL